MVGFVFKKQWKKIPFQAFKPSKLIGYVKFEKSITLN
jgi:hypothetical protein